MKSKNNRWLKFICAGIFVLFLGFITDNSNMISSVFKYLFGAVAILYGLFLKYEKS